jgi:flavin-dependent dehydrogenase
MTLEACDALIVGGGPAGSACAWTLCRAGLDVVVLDKASFPRDKTCAGWITRAVVEELALDVDDYRRGRAFQPITGFRTGRIGGRAIRTDYGRPVSYGIRRCEFDDYLLRRSGARLVLGSPLKEMCRSKGEWIVDHRLRSPVVVGAGGHFCPVARRLGCDAPPAASAVFAQEIEFEMDPGQRAECSVEPEVPELYFCGDLRGYGWCFRKGNFLNVGLGRDDRQSLARHVERFCDLMRRQGRIPRSLPGPFHGHAYYLHDRSPRKLLDDGVLLIGDAAGLAYAQSGEGIRPAIESGLVAAEVILRADGDYKRQNLEPYREFIDARFARSRSRNIGAPSRAKQLAAALLLRTHWFTRHVLLDRWFLHVHEPPLARQIEVGAEQKAIRNA